MNTKRKIEDYIGKDIAIHCSSKEEWNKIVDLFDNPTVKKHYWENFLNGGKSDTISITGRGWSPKEHFIKKQYIIYPASDFLEEGKPFNVGDLVYLEKHYKHKTESSDYSTDLPLNSPLEIKRIDFTSRIYGNKEKEWALWFKGRLYGHPACKFKLWENTTPEYIEILQENCTYTQKGRIYKVLSWGSNNCWVVCNVKCGGYDPGSKLCIDEFWENKSWWKPSTKEAYDLQEIKQKIEMLPYPKDKKYFKAVVTKDIHREDIPVKGDIPELIPKGYQTWFISENTIWREKILLKEYVVCPENNRWGANIPAEYFEIMEDKKTFGFEEGKWYKTENYYIKYSYTETVEGTHSYNKIWGEIVNHGEYKKFDYLANTGMETELKILTDLSEIQQYLPEGHPDKFKVETPINKTKDFIKSTASNSQVEIKIKNRNPIVKETIKKRNRLEIKPIKQTIKLKHYVNI